MSEEQRGSKMRFAPVILAGGSGTRFWPRSRRARAKQVLALDGEQTMIQQTVERLLPVADAGDVWVITNELLSEVICEQLPAVPCAQILSEPAARNTAPACALAAFLLERNDPGTVIGSISFGPCGEGRAAVCGGGTGRDCAGSEGRDDCGAGGSSDSGGDGLWVYRAGGDAGSSAGVEARKVRRFTEKPLKEKAEEFLAAGNYAWNSGIFLWRARTLANAIREYRPEMAPLLEKIAAALWDGRF